MIMLITHQTTYSLVHSKAGMAHKCGYKDHGIQTSLGDDLTWTFSLDDVSQYLVPP